MKIICDSCGEDCTKDIRAKISMESGGRYWKAVVCERCFSLVKDTINNIRIRSGNNLITEIDIQGNYG